MPSSPATKFSPARLVLIGAVLPAIYVTVNTWLLRHLSLAPLMAALVVEVGSLGLLCGKFVRPLWLMWLIYGWMWLVMDMMVVPHAMREVWSWESISADTLPVALLSGQLGLVIVWAMLGESRWTIRWPVALLLAAVIFVPIVWHKMRPTELLILLVLQSAILAAVCGLLAGLRFRLVVVHSDGQAALPQEAAKRPESLRTSQFQLRDVLLWTTALAIALAIARAVGYWGASLEIWQQVKAGLTKSGIFAVFLPTPTEAIFTALVLLIALWAALGAGRAWVRWSFFAIYVVAAAMACGVIDYYRLAQTWRPPPSLWYLDNWDLLWFYERSTIHWFVLVGGMLFAALLILRTLGYRLCRVAASQ